MTAPLAPSETRQGRVGVHVIDELQARIRGMQATRLEQGALVPTLPAVASALPAGGLREGSVVRVDGSNSLLMALLAGPSAAGRWVAVAGIPEFGVEAAARFGIDLERLVLVPHPGRQWLTVAAALVDVIPVVAVRPGGNVSAAEAARFSARLHQRGATMLVAGAWPGSDASVGVERSEWHGLGVGHGRLAEREVVLAARGRAEIGRAMRRRLLLPDRDLAVTGGQVAASVGPADEGTVVHAAFAGAEFADTEFAGTEFAGTEFDERAAG